MPADEEFLEQARARWTSIAGDRPALSAAVGLQRVLVERTVEILTSITPDMARLLTGPVQLAEKIRCGKPLLHDEILPVPVELLAPHLSGFCETLARGGAGDSARHIGDALREQRLDAGSMLSASLARDQIAFRQGAALLDLSADLLWLVAELAAGPFAFVLQEIARESSEIAAAFAKWDRGLCPACGSWPMFVEIVEGCSRPRCSFCGASWSHNIDRCGYCDEAGEAFSTMIVDRARPGDRLAVCKACRGYVKVLEFPAPLGFPLLAVEDLASSHLDVAAMDRGYQRPTMPSAAGATPRGCGLWRTGC